MVEVLIDGVEYIPRKDLISDECLKIMGEVYGALWGRLITTQTTNQRKNSRPLSRIR
jgi:hypothetical protein